MPTIRITAADDCLINNTKELIIYDTYTYLEIIPTYEGDIERRVEFWQFYDQNGDPYIKIKNGEVLTYIEYGVYTVEPIFTN